jgi:16S rRNA (cytosine967-C5)-methyltransferase
MLVLAYLDTAIFLLEHYKGAEPLNAYLKNYFAKNKKFGSRDRKVITHLCYCFFRLGKAFENVSVKDRIAIGLFLCSDSSSKVLEHLHAHWNEQVAKPLSEKIELVKAEYPFDELQLFSLDQYISPNLNQHLLNLSLLIQPNIYLRVRPNKETVVKQKLEAAAIPFQQIEDNCLVLPPNAKADAAISLNKEAVIQDLNSQHVFDGLLDQSLKESLEVWDCCAASGGKSILIKDLFPDASLTVSDVRESILANLRKRVAEAGIHSYKWFVTDLSLPNFQSAQTYDLVICDAPCSGSGTWGRTPEQLYFFGSDKLNHYTNLQKKIVSNAVKGLKKDSYLLYITCSVFKAENEEVVDFIQQQFALQLVNQQYYIGYNKKADTLFAALFIQP